ncbi:uncharacterized protein LAESUDRAFT_738004 [Laetiporus sulphureus 93-53]|uniref:CxC6 like cysteine cluster associated with KDZ domain-containing protein n=1 Tax=Laetiporus sulphureus 93-53 TaxID=1314785 RepID=A0A165D5N0_9APHY|nr:uncharacterized protein LAESUDRAFT_738004 [Laetiporus sulphureus 93-53]KZT04193.1 hypothetical protein LAESUDRAFT_738004 [Laetiporus sulphureus 93-53]
MVASLPACTTSLYCCNCHMRYHSNHYVHGKPTTHTYYPCVPCFIQVAQHFFVTDEVCKMFANLMIISWTSVTNCARFYNESLIMLDLHSALPSQWSSRLDIMPEYVWDAFFLYSLLTDHCECTTVLQLPHNAPSQDECLCPALHARNMLLASSGQEDAPEALHSVVTDGVSIGHPCCAVHDCMQLLIMTKDTRYCSVHAAKDKLADAGFMTCLLPSHCALESFKQLENKAMFQLKHCLECLRMSQLKQHDSQVSTLPSVLEELEVCAEHDITAADKMLSNILPQDAQFGHRRTHIEELCVTSCGVNLGCATFFGSEAINGVLTQAFFEGCALLIDIFHFKCKHKEIDIICDTHCNPYLWSELRTNDDQWRFNSSAAEQANVWFGKYQAIIREMQMVKHRNHMIVRKLERKGHKLYIIPREELLAM